MRKAANRDVTVVHISRNNIVAIYSGLINHDKIHLALNMEFQKGAFEKRGEVAKKVHSNTYNKLQSYIKYIFCNIKFNSTLLLYSLLCASDTCMQNSVQHNVIIIAHNTKERTIAYKSFMEH